MRGRSYAEGTQRGSDACPLHLLCKCGVPACRFRAVEQLTLAVAPGKFWRKGLLRLWLTADIYRGFTSLDSGIFSQNFNTVTNFVKLKLQVQFDICCRTGLILRSLTEAKRNWTFAPRGRTNSRQSAVSLLQFTYDLVFNPPRRSTPSPQ